MPLGKGTESTYTDSLKNVASQMLQEGATDAKKEERKIHKHLKEITDKEGIQDPVLPLQSFKNQEQGLDNTADENAAADIHGSDPIAHKPW